MKVCVIGGGNIGLLLTAEFSQKGYDTTLYSKHISLKSNRIRVLDGAGKELFTADSFRVTDKPEEALPDAEQIWITYPAFLLPALAQQIAPLLGKGQTLVFVPGSGGVEYAFASVIRKGVTVCGLQRVRCISRTQGNDAVLALGKKDSVHLASIPSCRAEELSAQIAEMLSIPCVPLPNYLCVTLTPSNPILHTSRLYSMFRDYQPGMVYDHNILFYEEWTDDASSVLFAADSELQALCANIRDYDLSSVVSLRIHYESDTIPAMTKKISGIRAFKGITSPMKETENGWVPDFASRYFRSDFSFGLKVLIELAGQYHTEVPVMKKMFDWYLSLNPGEADACFRIAEGGLITY